jgi:hypothetical protein
MKNWYKISQVNGTQDSDSYVASVDVSVYGGDTAKYDIELPRKKIDVPFRLDLDVRSWGIKNIGVLVDGMINVPIFLNDIETSRLLEERNVVVDLAKINKEEIKGNGAVTLGEMDLYLDQNLNVDYKSSSLEIYR